MTSDSSASTTPMPLTPESTGSGGGNITFGLTPGSPESVSSSATVAAKARRQTAFYPNMNSTNKPLKPFSRSAAKRESVMALGSIEHLQHYFTKTGLAAKKNPLDKLHHGLVPAIGGISHVPTSPPPPDLHEFHLPPLPTIPRPPSRPEFTPHTKTHEVHPDSLLPGVINDLTTLTRVWHIEISSTATGSSNTDSPIEVLSLLKTTTRTIRSVRNYVMSLPDESAGSIRSQFRSKHLQPSSRGSSSSSSNPSNDATSSRVDPLALIRRSALEVLACLRELEETSRLPLSDDAYDAQSDGGASRGNGANTAEGNSRMTSPSNPTFDLPPDEPSPPSTESDDVVPHMDPDISFTFSLVQVQGRYESIPVWEEENDGFDDDDKEKEKRELWDERLEVGNGWLYRQDIKLADLPKERSVVINYINVVDEVLFNGPDGSDGSQRRDVPTSSSHPTERGWEREQRKLESRSNKASAPRSRSKSRRVSAGDTEGHSFGLPPAHDAGSASKRRVSTGMLHLAVGGMRLTSEPEDMGGIKEEEGDGEGDRLPGEETGESEAEFDGEESMDDEDLPQWAKRSSFIDSDFDRAYAFIHSFLPRAFQTAVIPPSTVFDFPSTSSSILPSRTAFLASLSSGQLLCIAYNACVRKSKRPWGFVSKDGIHDIIALEKAAAASALGADSSVGTGKTSWTFRRTDNLRLWSGALKLRYMLPIQMPSHVVSAVTPGMLKLPSITTSIPAGTPLSSPKAGQKFNLITGGNIPVPSTSGSDKGNVDTFVFDAKVVARKEDGWEDMLENALLKWVWKAVEEQRSVR